MADDTFYDPYFDTNFDAGSATSSSTTVADSAGSDGSGWLSGLTDLFQAVGTTIGSTFTQVSRAQSPSPTLGVPTGYYRNTAGQVVPLPQQPINMNLILVVGVIIVAVVLLKK